MSRRIPEIGGAAVCFALAVAFAVAFAHYSTDNARGKVVRVEADFSPAPTHDVDKRGADGKMRTKEPSVDAVYQLNGKTYRHRVSEEWAARVVSGLPGRGAIFVDANDPTRPPHMTPVGFASLPLLGAIMSTIVGAMFAVAAWRHRRRSTD